LFASVAQDGGFVVVVVQAGEDDLGALVDVIADGLLIDVRALGDELFLTQELGRHLSGLYAHQENGNCECDQCEFAG
jgi:hypothetical protein